jgi:ferritin-like protein
MTFEEWMKYNNYSLKGMDEHEAEFLMREAWNYQQERINLLEKRIVDLQGHDDLSYIDKKLSEQEGK